MPKGVSKEAKSQADQAVLNEYIEKSRARTEQYSRMIFAVHSPTGALSSPTDRRVHVWQGARLTKLVVRLGLGEWIERKLG